MLCVFFFKQKTAYELRISDWSSYVCSSDLNPAAISREQLDSWIAEGVIEYLGETRDVTPYLAAATVYVLPSYRDGLPRTVLEAMSTGRAIITTDAPGCREPVTQGQNGLLVPVRAPAALAEAMLRFVHDPDLASGRPPCRGRGCSYGE